MLTLNIEKRTIPSNLGKIRRSGKIPAVYYGPKEKSTPISLDISDFTKAWKQAGETSVVNLKGDGMDLETLIHVVTTDPVKGIPTHVDFYVMEKGKTVEIEVPIEFIGVSPAVKSLGGTLVKVLYELEVEALPKDLPKELEVDISSLVDFESKILAQDIKLPPGVKLVTKADEIIALVAETKEEEEVVESAPDLSAIEVVDKKGKKEEEGAEAEVEEKK
ncbi:MAG: 50S ribosomal protein L25 [Candidatus Paceibacterota bacterium]